MLLIVLACYCCSNPWEPQSISMDSNPLLDSQAVTWRPSLYLRVGVYVFHVPTRRWELGYVIGSSSPSLRTLDRYWESPYIIRYLSLLLRIACVLEGFCFLLRAWIHFWINWLLDAPTRSRGLQPVIVSHASHSLLETQFPVLMPSLFLGVILTFCPLFGEPSPFVCVLLPSLVPTWLKLGNVLHAPCGIFMCFARIDAPSCCDGTMEFIICMYSANWVATLVYMQCGATFID